MNYVLHQAVTSKFILAKLKNTELLLIVAMQLGSQIQDLLPQGLFTLVVKHSPKPTSRQATMPPDYIRYIHS